MKKAFSLAEVLITLSVLGVLMAYVIPLVSGIIPNRDKFYFLKTYFSLEQAVAKMVNNNGLYDEYSNAVLDSPTQAGVNTPDEIRNYFCQNLRRELMVQPKKDGETDCDLTFKTGQTAEVKKHSNGFVVEIPFFGRDDKPKHKIYISSQGTFTVDQNSEEAKYLNDEMDDK